MILILYCIMKPSRFDGTLQADTWYQLVVLVSLNADAAEGIRLRLNVGRQGF